MASVKHKQEDDQQFAYVILHNGMDNLLNEIDQFCKGEYGRSCELYKAYIAKKDPNSYSSKVHEFEGVGADLLDRVRNHLKRARDFIKFEFSADGQDFDIDIVPGSQADYLVDKVQREDIDELKDTDTVVLVEMREDVDIAEEFLQRL